MTLESSIKNLIEKPLKALGYSEIDVKFVREFGTNYLRVMLDKDDEVISMSILKHISANADERDEYLRVSAAMKRMTQEEGTDVYVSPEQTD